jgi:hypothetical protein
MAINRNSYKSLLESIQDATETLDETDSMWLSRGEKATAKKSDAKKIAEEWDEIDEILAEGVEMYGEDGLAEILVDFAETGEISEELAEIIEAVAQFNPMELARHLNAGTHADYLAQFGHGIANPNAASLAPASKTAATNRKMAAKPVGMKPAARKPMVKPAMKARPSLKK